MNRPLLSSIVGLSLLLAGCGSAIGAACAQDDDCSAGQTCITQVPGGYCSKGCSQEGQTTECPGGSICATNAGQLLCSSICQSQSGCRPEYECNGVVGASAKVCRPKV